MTEDITNPEITNPEIISEETTAPIIKNKKPSKKKIFHRNKTRKIT